jgi:DMSO/TMAO reductase YedYZ heme-binding membrane subunit
MDPALAWYVARAAGLVAWGLATVSVLGGFALSGRFFGRRLVPPAWLADLHSALGGLTVIFTVVHVIALLLDDYVDFTVVDLLVPYRTSWRPGAVALGIVALYLLLAVQISSQARRRLPAVWWRRLHLLSVPVFGLGTLHLLAAGTDATHPLVRAAVFVAAGTFVLLAVFRVLSRPPRRPHRRHAARGSARATAATRGSDTRPVRSSAAASPARSHPERDSRGGPARASDPARG